MRVPSEFFRRVRRALKLLAIASLPFIIAGAVLCCWLREWALRDLPDIPEPFDIEAVAYPEIPADRNAFELYRLASERLRPLPDEFKERYFEFFRTDWLDLPGPLQEWLADNREALDAYRQGSERPQALYIQIGDQVPTTQLTVTQNLQYLSMLATFEARRLATARQVASAWEW